VRWWPSVAEEGVRTARRFFDLLRRKDVESWGELWHDEARILVLYPPGGFPVADSNTFRDGLIVEYHDCFDPRRFQVVVDALPGDAEP
jgi:hypothetical protein